MADLLSELLEKMSPFEQSHLLHFWEELSHSEQAIFAQQLQSINVGESCSFFKKSTLAETPSSPHKLLCPIDKFHSATAAHLPADVLNAYWTVGLEQISLGQVGVLLMAGGQGTRLGVSYPKGMFNVGLPSGKSLFQLQAERILRLQQLAKNLFPDRDGQICWYIMTSEATRPETVQFFLSHDHFGLNLSQVFFFTQGQLPCFTFDGKMILESKCSVAMAPDGNGGLYRALKLSGALAHMQSRKIRHVHAYGVDNILVRVGDPTFIGFCVSRQADCAAKTVTKEDPHEAVGVVCLVEGKIPQVVEYSEIHKDLAEQRDSTGSLLFRAGNIANHYFYIDFLVEICNKGEELLIHHVARKKIPFLDNTGVVVKPVVPNGLKLEKFVFDVFQFSKNFHVWEVDREAEFSPLKNSDQIGVECPSTCRDHLYKLHRRWLTQAGAMVDDTVVECEVSPLSSYGGEGCADLVKGKAFHSNPLLL